MAVSTSADNYTYIGATSDGVYVGPTTSAKLAFYGTAPIAQQATTATDITTTGVVTGGVFSTSTLSINFVTAVAEIQAALKALGLIT